MSYQVKTVSKMAGISVRTLHYYDSIGLLTPSGRSDTGYRLYSDGDLELLQQIMFYRELGLSLEEVRDLVHDPAFDRRKALLEQRRQLLERQTRLGRMVRLIDNTLDSMQRGVYMTIKELFDGFDQSKYEAEVRQRYGDEAMDECNRRTSRYTEADWKAIKAESESIMGEIASLMDQGRTPDDPDVQAQIRRHHRQINDRYYNCTLEIYAGLGNLYVDDERFTANYEKIRPGMAKFMQQAIIAYCDASDVLAP